MFSAIFTAILMVLGMAGVCIVGLLIASMFTLKNVAFMAIVTAIVLIVIIVKKWNEH